MNGEWRCEACGPVQPLHIASQASVAILEAITDKIRAIDSALPMWCLWPLLPGWTVTGAAWAGDPRVGPRATAVALSGPSPLTDGPADVVFVAEEPGVGLGSSLAGLVGPDAGPDLPATVESTPAQAKVRAGGHPTPLWAVPSLEDRCAYVGEARGVWLYALTWPAPAGYLLAETIVLHDLAESVPSELAFGAPTVRLRPHPVGR